MPVPFTVFEKHNVQKPTEPKRFYAQAKSRGAIEIRQIGAILSERSTVSMADVVAVLEGFIELVPEKLMEGYLVKLGEFGTFRLGFSCEGQDDASQVTSRVLTDVRVNFRPGKEIRNKLKLTRFERRK